MIKTVNLSGRETKVEGLDGFNTIVHNLGDDVIYASKNPNITPEADNVAEIPAGSAKLISTTNGTVYLLGIGKTELTGQDYDGVNYSSSSTAAVISSGGGTSDVTKAYVNAQDAQTLEAAMSYTDSVVNAAKDEIGQKLTETSGKITANSESISALQTAKADKSEVLEWLNTKADKSEVSEALDSAKAYTDEKIETVNGSISELQDTKADKSEISAASGGNNPNLLDNWWFVEPIDQRTYANIKKAPDTGYFIDRWRRASGNVTVSKKQGIILNGTIEQVLEFAPEQEVTASYLTSDGIQTATYDSATKTFSITTSEDTLIIAAKLEIGTEQTLARQEDDSWVLNDAPPNPALELAKCQRYQLIGTFTTAFSGIGALLLPTPVQMRKKPALVWLDVYCYDSTGKQIADTTEKPWGNTFEDMNGLMLTGVKDAGIQRIYGDFYLDANL